MQVDVSKALNAAKAAVAASVPLVIEKASETAAVLGQAGAGRAATRLIRKHPYLILAAAGVAAGLYLYRDRLQRAEST